MHLLFLTDNYPPECNAPATRTFEHAVQWVRSGHQVTVVTGFPNFPAGKVYAGYKNQWYKSEQIDGIRVVRVKTYIAANAGFLSRILDYCSFMFTGTVAACLQRKPDVVIATSPQFFCGIAGLLTSFLKRKPFVLEIRDIWPASIVAVGAMQDSFFIKAMEKVELLLYRKATAIVVVTRLFKQEMTQRGIEQDKIHVVLNGVDQFIFKPRQKNSALMDHHSLNGKFVIGYIGTHGLAHDLPNVLEAVRLLQKNSRLCFLFVGAGAERQRVEAIVAENELSNVRLIPQQPRSEIPRLMSLCDVCLVPLRNSPVFASVIPSKLFECQAMGIPVVMSLPAGEATSIVKDTGCGITVPPESPELLAAAIEELSTAPEQMKDLSRNAEQAAGLYARHTMAALMLDVLHTVVENRRAHAAQH